MRGKLSPAAKFWIGLTVYVILADTILWRKDQDTMSVQFGKWLETRKGKALCGLTWGTLTAHLFWSLPLPGQTKLKKIATYKRG